MVVSEFVKVLSLVQANKTSDARSFLNNNSAVRAADASLTINVFKFDSDWRAVIASEFRPSCTPCIEVLISTILGSS